MDSDIARQLKQALAASDFAAAQRLLPTYRDEVGSLLAAARTSEEREQIMQSFHDLLSLARVMRAHISAHLAAVKRDACYHIQFPAQHTWHFEG